MATLHFRNVRTSMLIHKKRNRLRKQNGVKIKLRIRKLFDRALVNANITRHKVKVIEIFGLDDL